MSEFSGVFASSHFTFHIFDRHAHENVARTPTFIRSKNVKPIEKHDRKTLTIKTVPIRIDLTVWRKQC